MSYLSHEQLRSADAAKLEEIAVGLPSLSQHELPKRGKAAASAEASPKAGGDKPVDYTPSETVPNSTLHQIVAYRSADLKHAGPESWRKRYLHFRAINFSEDRKGLQERREVWKSLDPLFRKFQEVFTDLHQRIVPRKVLDNSRTIDRPREKKDRMSVMGCIVTPRLVPEKLAARLGLIDPGRYKGKPAELFLEKAKPENLNILKLVWDHAEPIKIGNSRMLVIEKPDAGILHKFKPGYKLPRGLPGSILYTSKRAETGLSAASGPYDPPLYARQLKVQLFQNAYGALRKTIHEEQEYVREVMMLSELSADLQSFISRINEGWRKNTPAEEKEAWIDEWNTLRNKSIDVLKNSVDRRKVAARFTIDLLENFKDARGKENVTVAMTKVVKAIDRIKNRLNHPGKIGGFNTQDKLELVAELHSQETAITKYCQSLSEKQHIINSKMALFSGSKMSAKEIQSNVRGLMAALKIRETDLYSVRLRPLRSIARLLVIKHRELEKAALRRDLAGAREACDHIGRISQLADKIIISERSKFDSMRGAF